MRHEDSSKSESAVRVACIDGRRIEALPVRHCKDVRPRLSDAISALRFSAVLRPLVVPCSKFNALAGLSLTRRQF